MLLPLPMTPAQCLAEVIAPTFHDLLPGKFDSVAARGLLLATAIQESDLRFRRQVGGPAMGLWQFEQGGGVHGVLHSEASRTYARMVCQHRAVAPTERDLYMALSHDDLLACAIARLNYWTEPSPLPRWGFEQAGFDYYRETWRPGAWHVHPQEVRERWHRSYARALSVLPA